MWSCMLRTVKTVLIIGFGTVRQKVSEVFASVLQAPLYQCQVLTT